MASATTLHGDVLGLVLKRLPARDVLAASRVCRFWRSVVFEDVADLDLTAMCATCININMPRLMSLVRERVKRVESITVLPFGLITVGTARSDIVQQLWRFPELKTVRLMLDRYRPHPSGLRYVSDSLAWPQLNCLKTLELFNVTWAALTALRNSCAMHSLDAIVELRIGLALVFPRDGATHLCELLKAMPGLERLFLENLTLGSKETESVLHLCPRLRELHVLKWDGLGSLQRPVDMLLSAAFHGPRLERITCTCAGLDGWHAGLYLNPTGDGVAKSRWKESTKLREALSVLFSSLAELRTVVIRDAAIGMFLGSLPYGFFGGETEPGVSITCDRVQPYARVCATRALAGTPGGR